MIENNTVHIKDNLELMKEMNNNSVDLIYSDILYNTGKKFKDYEDKLGTTKEAIEWYKPRLKEMYRVLKDTGSIYLHCDWRLSHYLKVELDSLFGENNFKNEIIWHYNGIKRKTARKFPQKNDSILFYTKSKEYTWNTQYQPHKEEYIKRFKKDENGRLYRDDVNPTKGGSRVIYLDEVEGDIMDSVWYIPIVNPMAKEKIGYYSQKPKELLKRIISASTNEGDVVADFFCGSGTTLVVAKDLKRRYIGCDINQLAIKITENRLKEIN